MEPDQICVLSRIYNERAAAHGWEERLECPYHGKVHRISPKNVGEIRKHFEYIQALPVCSHGFTKYALYYHDCGELNANRR